MTEERIAQLEQRVRELWIQNQELHRRIQNAQPDPLVLAKYDMMRTLIRIREHLLALGQNYEAFIASTLRDQGVTIIGEPGQPLTESEQEYARFFIGNEKSLEVITSAYVIIDTIDDDHIVLERGRTSW